MDEKIISGYCRCLDQNRMVTVEKCDDCGTEVDCSYGNCVHQANCLIAKNIQDFLEK